MAHPKARLNVLGRELLVTRVTVLGWPVVTAADAQGISRATGYKWVRRFRAEGTAGLADRSSRPHRSPRATPAAEVHRILTARAEWRWGPDRLGPLLELPRSTVAAVLHRESVPRLADLDRPTGLPVRRYQACHPGELVHQDHKKLGRIPDGGGHRVLDRSTETRRRKPGLGYDHFEVVIDDRSRRSVVVQVPDESGASTAAALDLAITTFEADGIAVERVMTDNAWAYRGREYRAVLGDRRQTRTRPYRPQTNGKAERFIGTLAREWGVCADVHDQHRPFGRLADVRRLLQSPADRTLRSVASAPRPLSTTSMGITARRPVSIGLGGSDSLSQTFDEDVRVW